MADTNTLTSWAEFVRTRIERLKADFPELLADAELLSGMVEGETDFDVVIDKIIDAHLEHVFSKEAAELRRADLDTRITRFGKAADAMRGLALDLMQAAGMSMVRRPQATLVVSRGRDRLELDPDFNAQGYMRVKSEPMKDDIRAALAAGDQIPGARLVPSEPHLSIRTK